MRAQLLIAGLTAAIFAGPGVAAAAEPSTSTTARPPDPAEHRKKDTRRARHGGLGFMQLGVMAGPIGDVTNALAAETALGPGARSPEFGYTIGGGGRLLLFHRLLIGGKGFFLFAPKVGGRSGTAKLGGGGGGLELGFVAVSRPRVLFFPYFGVGGFGLGLELENTSQDRIALGESEPLDPDEIRDFEAGFVYLEIGAGLHRLLFFHDGGFAVGFNLGGLFSVKSLPWTDNGATVGGLDRPRLSGATLQLTLGGGGFHFR